MTTSRHQATRAYSDDGALARAPIAPAADNALAELFELLDENRDKAVGEIDREQIERAVDLARRSATDANARQQDLDSLAVAKITSALWLDTPTLAAALLHGAFEDGRTSLDEIRRELGEEVARLVEEMTQLRGIRLGGRDERTAESHRLMMLAMATDLRVVLLQLADHLHDMRGLDGLPKRFQFDKASETLDVFAPLAHRLGIHAMSWELEDLAFATLHPRKYQEIKVLVGQRYAEHRDYLERAGEVLLADLRKLGIEADVSGRQKHYYSIYSKMVKKGRTFNEIQDLTGIRVLVGSIKDCYGAIGVIHSLWKPLPGRFKDYVAMPKFNMYQALHTTVIGPENQPLEIQIRTDEMHEWATTLHWFYKHDPSAPAEARPTSQFTDWQNKRADPRELAASLTADLTEGKVPIFTPAGEVIWLVAGANPIDFAYAIHTDVGQTVTEAKINGKKAPLHQELRTGDICEVLTSSNSDGPRVEWLDLVKTRRAQKAISRQLARQRRDRLERTGRQLLHESLLAVGLSREMGRSWLLVEIAREMGYIKSGRFFAALGEGKVSTDVVSGEVLRRTKQGREVGASVELYSEAPDTASQVTVDGWKRPGLLEDILRVFGDAGIGILAVDYEARREAINASLLVDSPDGHHLRANIKKVGALESVFDAYLQPRG